MAVGTVKSYNVNKGYGFATHQGKDIFLYVEELEGMVVKKGDKLNFTIKQDGKGPNASNIKFVGGAPEEYWGKIKTFDYKTGYGFITSDAFPGQDILFMRHELLEGARDTVQPDSFCTFKVEVTDRGPTATNVWLVGAAGLGVRKTDGRRWGGKGGGGDKGGANPMMQMMQMLMGGGGGKGVRKPMFQKSRW